MSTGFTDQTVLLEGKPPALRRPDFWAKLLSESMDLFAFAALYVSGEVQSWPIWVAAGMSLLRMTLRYRFRAIWMFIGFLLLIFLGVELCLRIPLHPIVSAAHVAPIGIAWMSLSRNAEDFWGWRTGLGFITLILASALSPDFSVTLFIILFVVAGSINISCRFLDLEFTKHGVIGTLPRGFIRSSLKQTGILFIAALIIFPLIPRMEGRSFSNFGSESPKTGYTEDVSLSEWSRVSSRGSSAPALRIYGPDGEDPNHYIPAGLLRSRVLSVLSDNRWDPLPTRTEVRGENTVNLKPRGTLKIVREMMGPATLPVPYGTIGASVEHDGFQWPAERTSVLEWRENRARNQRFTYNVSVGETESRRPQDKPTALDTRVPQRFKSPRVVMLADRLFKGLKDPLAKAHAVQSFLGADFRAAYLEDDVPLKADAAESTLPPIERFLFVEKSGHCELFASSMAILLRLGGVPTRLIAGFRIGRSSMGDVITVRQQDAHAWVEVYLPGQGWHPYDPTPKLLQPLALTDWLRDSYDWASAKWTQYILKYGEGGNSLLAQLSEAKKVAEQIAAGKNPFANVDAEVNTYLFFVIFSIGSFSTAFAFVAFVRFFRRKRGALKNSHWVRKLGRERDALERAVRSHRRRNPRSQIRIPEVEQWFQTYEALRFGKSLDTEDSTRLRNLRDQRLKIARTLRTAS